MFGYFRPFEAIGNSVQKRAFSAHYCRLCYCLRSLGGQRARAFTTFDATIYGMIYCIATRREPPSYTPCERIKKNNMRKFSSDEFGMRLARISLVAFGEKLRDDRLDGEFSFKMALLSFLSSGAIRKAEREEPEVTRESRYGSDEVNKLQAEGASLGDVLSAYGRSVANVFSCIGEMPDNAWELIRAIAEWTFFVDMLCDYDEDLKDGKPNSFHRPDCPTLKDFFDKNYDYLIKENRRMNDAVIRPLLALNDGSDDWKAVYMILTHALDTVVVGLLSGDDVEFHYFKELGKNYKALQEHNKQKSLENCKDGKN